MSEQPIPQPPKPTMATSARVHPSVTQVLRWFDASHLPPHLKPISTPIGDLARQMATQLDSTPELTEGLRRLLDAKDSLVRAAQATYERITAEEEANARPTASHERPE